MSNETKTHWKKLMNPDYLGAYELLDGSAPNGKELVAVIEKIDVEPVKGSDGKSKPKTICHLKGHKKMILNSTNQKAISKALKSNYIDDWIGKKITIYVAKVDAFGDMVDALRIKPVPPTLPTLTPQHEKWGGAVKSVQSGATTIEAIKLHFILSAENEALLTAKPQ